MLNWLELDRRIPWMPFEPGDSYGSKRTIVGTGKSWSLEVGQPGVHWSETYKPGGDFVVRVTSEEMGWIRKAFTHADMFEDIDRKLRWDAQYLRGTLMPALVDVIATGRAPEEKAAELPSRVPGLVPSAFLAASQCLALCEHRRYRGFEPRGGRYLPTYFMMGIAWETWGSTEAIVEHRKGLPGLRRLRRRFGHEPSLDVVLKGTDTHAYREGHSAAT